jgi:hypothetical protein
MATVKELEKQLAEMREVLARSGIILPNRRAREPQQRADYIEHGSPEHAAFMGLVPLEGDEIGRAKADGYAIYKSDKGSYRLEDEIAALHLVPGVVPRLAALVVLRQKVGAFESGVPQVPANAPAMFRPVVQP